MLCVAAFRTSPTRFTSNEPIKQAARPIREQLRCTLSTLGKETMDAVLQAFLNDTSALESRRVEQVVAICGNGTLSDNSECSRGFREFLRNLPSKILKKYSKECLDGTMPRNQNSGLILQDLVNEVGDRLGYRTEPGYYRGSPSRIGHDGLWVSPDFSFVLEVKTSDLSIKLDTIANYRRLTSSRSGFREWGRPSMTIEN